MKHAILITAYKELNALVDLIDTFGKEFNFYIHVDKKSKMEFSILCERENVFIVNTYKVNWGGFNHLKAIILLSTESLKNSNNTFFHLITAEDFPIRDKESFYNLDTTINYLEYFELPDNQWAGNGGLDRIRYFQLYDILNARKNRIRDILQYIVYFQKIIRIKRGYSKKFPKKIFGGSTYWSLNRSALSYVVNYDKKFFSRFKFTFCAEEIYFQTILLNSPYVNNIVNNNLRFIDWSSGRGGYPAFLDESDFDSLINSDKYFARKVKSDSKLKILLKQHGKNDV